MKKRKTLSVGMWLRVLQLVETTDTPAKAIANRFNIGYPAALRLCAARRPKATPVESKPDMFVELISAISNKCLHGALPPREKTVDFVAVCLELFVPEDTEPAVRDYVAAGLVRGLDCLRRQENATWTH